MKKKLLFFATLFSSLIFSNLTFAESNFNIQITPYTGISAGQLDEVWYSSYNYRCSLLEWQKMPLSITGIRINPTIYNFNLTLDGNIGLPLACGYMYDSDWDGDGIKHTYSVNDCYAKLNTNLNLTLGYDFNFKEKFSLSPILNIQYDFNKLESRNGHGWYGASWATGLKDDVWWYDERARKAKLYGVDFYRHSLFTFFGVSFLYNPIQLFEINLGLQISPYAYYYTCDHHLNKSDGYYYVFIQNGYWSKFKINLDIYYSINKKLKLYASFLTLFGSEAKGSLYANIWANQGLSLSDQTSGSNSWNIDIKAGCTFNF